MLLCFNSQRHFWILHNVLSEKGFISSLLLKDHLAEYTVCLGVLFLSVL